MENKIKILLIVCILLLFSIGGYFLAIRILDNAGRKMVYEDNTYTDYPGYGNITKLSEATIFMNPLYDNKPFFISPHDLEFSDDIAVDRYEQIQIPEQEQILYTVGAFEGWEDINGTLDKYMIVNTGNNTVERRRVSFEESDLFKDEFTTLLIERVNLGINKKHNEIIKPALNNFIKMSEAVVDPIFKKDDVLILIPVLDPPLLNKMDESGNFLISKVIIRRRGGTIEN